MKGRSRTAITILFVPLAVFLRTGQAFPSLDEWIEVESPHFLVYSNAGEGRARRIARQFEQIRSVYRSVLPNARVQAAKPVHILAARDEQTLRRLLPELWEQEGAARPSGVFIQGSYSHYIVLRVDARGARPFGPIYHEYFHVLVTLNSPDIPSWLNEGLAELWDATEIRGREVQIGVPNRDHLLLLRDEELLPLEVLLTADAAAPHYREEQNARRFYAQSWALAHLLMFTGQEKRDALAAYMGHLEQGIDSLTAAKRSFGDIAELEDELRTHIRRRRFTGIAVEAPAPPRDGELALRRLTAAESDAVLGRFLVHRNRLEDAAALLAGAVARDPDFAAAHEGMGLLHLARQEWERAEASFARALALSPEGYLANYFFAVLSTGTRRPMEEHLLRSVALNPSFALGYATLADFYEEHDGDLERALGLARRAVLLEPESPGYRLNVARLLSQVGELDEARKLGRQSARLAVRSRNADVANDVCWYGSLAGLAREVLPACELGVETDPENYRFRRSRGIARALSGDRAGAIADLQFCVERGGGWESRDAVRRLRSWIRALAEGRNPFDAPTLAELRKGT